LNAGSEYDISFKPNRTFCNQKLSKKDLKGGGGVGTS